AAGIVEGGAAMRETTSEPHIVQYGPSRVIGLFYRGKNENREVPGLWDGENGFLSRMGEVVQPEGAYYLDSGRHPAYGLCRCIPGATDGTFEYIAAVPAAADAPIPEGMIEALIPAGTYLVFPVAGLDKLPEVWNASHEWMGAHPEWKSYCTGPEDCDCANHPNFELYPPEFGVDEKLFIYLPVKPAS
ncbi:MAG: GyrI-like domain-containing protein, partial [Bacteroidota bacterium]